MTVNIRTSGSVTDDQIKDLDRSGIWEFLWKMRKAGAGDRSVRIVKSRWEKLTGRRYYG